jgi:SAM-dependent methyltransferase
MKPALEFASLSDHTQMPAYLRGEKLYGNDLSAEGIGRWFEAETDGYADLWGKDRTTYRYEYHALNHLHGYRHLPKRQFDNVLSVGGAYGDELLPILPTTKCVTILEPASKFAARELHGVPVTYVTPNPLGDMPFDSDRFDLTTCYGCLHHVPNVSFVLAELHRCLAPGGWALIRDPVVSMGDWRNARDGLTKNERGIPLDLFRQMITGAGFDIVAENLCVFPLTTRLRFLFDDLVFNSKTATRLDMALSRAFAFNVSYHPTGFLQRLQPTAVAYVLRKPAHLATR